MGDFASDQISSPRWNSWSRVSPVQFEREDRPIPRGVRLCCAAARAGDPVQTIEGDYSARCVLSSSVASFRGIR